MKNLLCFSFGMKRFFLPKDIGFPSTGLCFGFEDFFFAEGFVLSFFWHEEGFLPKDIGFPSTVLNESHEYAFF